MNNNSLFTINDVSFAYNETTVLHNLSLSLLPGKFYGLVGPNGCGKTTFLDLLTGIKKPHLGTIELKSKPIHQYNKRDLARLVSLVPQEFDTGFGFTVDEVVMMGRHPHIDRFNSPSLADYEHVDAALENIGISELRDRYTNTLSGGQKQRAVVARALAQNCPTLLLDEATSSLDIKYTLQIFNLVRKLVQKEGRTVIAVIHNLNLAAAYCDQLVFMQNGHIMHHGPTADNMTSEIIKEVFDVESQIIWDEYNQSNQVSFQYRDLC